MSGSKAVRPARRGEPECPVCGAGWCKSVDERHLLNMADGTIVPVGGPRRYWTSLDQIQGVRPTRNTAA